jgi:hypothetical protein
VQRTYIRKVSYWFDFSWSILWPDESEAAAGSAPSMSASVPAVNLSDEPTHVTDRTYTWEMLNRYQLLVPWLGQERPAGRGREVEVGLLRLLVVPPG